jgi:hypothetical protein
MKKYILFVSVLILGFILIGFGVAFASEKVSITTPSILPNATVGYPYSTKILVTGGTGSYTWKTKLFPARLNFIPSQMGADITGTFLEKGLRTFSVTVTSGNTECYQTIYFRR